MKTVRHENAVHKLVLSEEKKQADCEEVSSLETFRYWAGGGDPMRCDTLLGWVPDDSWMQSKTSSRLLTPLAALDACKRLDELEVMLK